MARPTPRGARHIFPRRPPFLSLRRGERWLGEAETEWGNHLATAADGHNKGIRRKHRLAPRGRPPLRRASLDTSPPIDGGEEGLPSATAAEDGADSEGQLRCRKSSRLSASEEQVRIS
ncbi:MAG: hypothetical protein EOR60_31430 [Mesorhizobium sp.]|nr:MAG: hypothetical protein EOR60_31430 [Mesorhizobium sp.]